MIEMNLPTVEDFESITYNMSSVINPLGVLALIFAAISNMMSTISNSILKPAMKARKTPFEKH